VTATRRSTGHHDQRRETVRFAATTAALERDFDAHTKRVGQRDLCEHGRDVIASGGRKGGTVVAWDRTNGTRLCEASAEGGVNALSTLGEGRFVAGTGDSGVVFFTHDGGFDVTKSARIVAAQESAITFFRLVFSRRYNSRGFRQTEKG
jgi:WD40 repeat protein